MISIIIDIDDIEISMTADQAIRLRDELNRLTGQPAQPAMPYPVWPQGEPIPVYPPYSGDPYPGGWSVTTDRITVRQNGTDYPA